MAYLSLTSGENQFSWRIVGLSKAFSQTNGYTMAGITKYQFTQSSSSISGIVDSITAPSSGTSTSTTLRTVLYSPGSYTFWAFTRVQDGTYWPAGSATVTVAEPRPVRPQNWYWYSTISSGSPINISAVEWNDFLNRINEFRVYSGLYEYGAFEYAYSGKLITASAVEHAVYAIRTMNPPVSTPTAPSKGDVITAYIFNRLRDSLNSL